MEKSTKAKAKPSLQVKCSIELRSAFISSCRSQDQTASQVLRAYMNTYVAKHGQMELL